MLKWEKQMTIYHHKYYWAECQVVKYQAKSNQLNISKNEPLELNDN